MNSEFGFSISDLKEVVISSESEKSYKSGIAVNALTQPHSPDAGRTRFLALAQMTKWGQAFFTFSKHIFFQNIIPKN